jgi:excisionase family DNA binding protein
MKLLTRAEAAAALRISAVTLWKLSQRRQLPVVRLGRRRLYDERDLEAFVLRHKSRQEKI